MRLNQHPHTVPLVSLHEGDGTFPAKLHEKELVFRTPGVVPNGTVREIKYVPFISPKDYTALPGPFSKQAVGRIISQLNMILEQEAFICMGPGRWGTVNPELGVGVSFADIYNAKALVELSGSEINFTAEPSFGTHFFQDLVEASIFPLAIDFDNQEVDFNHAFFYQTPNQLNQFIQTTAEMEDCVRVIAVDAFKPGYSITLVMGNQGEKAIAFF